MTRRIQVPAARLERWLHGFDERHHVVASSYQDDRVLFLGSDAERAEVLVPFGPISSGSGEGLVVRPLVDHVFQPRRVGVILVRLGGYAVGVFDAGVLTVSKVGSRLVHGRHKKGGSSSGRFARRRENEARQLFEAVVNTVARVVLPHESTLDAVIVGGDRSAVRTVLADTRLSGLAALVREPFLPVPDPKLRILQDSYESALAITIDIIEGDLA